MNEIPAPLPVEEPALCADCGKPMPLCVCAALQRHTNRVFVLVLRHPQEQDKILGTARLLTQQLDNSLLKTGLSWASLSQVLGRPTEAKKWGVLFLGSAKTAEPLPRQVLTALTTKGMVAIDQTERLQSLEGIILLDGTWQQAKALWWRNAWLLKCQRLVLQPPRRSLYGKLRREPRAESVATLEAAAFALAALEPEHEWERQLLPAFQTLLQKVALLPTQEKLKEALAGRKATKTKNAYKRRR
ncbi:MAG: DTW domain-containing protein [Alphaproteobacteria bacterium]|nr:DTW domain-containing protein [Alphaproteobacteria bacterium]